MWIEVKRGYINSELVEYFYIDCYDVVAHTASGEDLVIKEIKSEQDAKRYLATILHNIEEEKKK